MNTLFAMSDAPYGTERAYTPLRPTVSVAKHEGPRVRRSTYMIHPKERP